MNIKPLKYLMKTIKTILKVSPFRFVCCIFLLLIISLLPLFSLIAVNDLTSFVSSAKGFQMNGVNKVLLYGFILFLSNSLTLVNLIGSYF